jgi:IS1 family transposase
MNKLDIKTRSQVVAALVEGNSIRATVRMTGVAKKTVLRILCEVGEACWTYQQLNLKNLPCRRIQCDEIWSFCYAKDKNLPDNLKDKWGFGSVWTWTALCADTKLVPAWFVGKRDAHAAYAFMKDLAHRLKNRVQLTTDGHRAYLEAVENTFGDGIDFAQLVKIYRATPGPEGKYSPGECCGAVKTPVTGNVDQTHVSTSFVERQNLTMRMQMRRFTRLTNAFSKKLRNLQWAVALHFMHYNFCRIHQSLRVTPAMAARVTDRVWEIEDVLRLAYPDSK